MEKLFNFDYNGKKHPNYRVDYETESGAPSVSIPAIFKSNREGIFAALRKYLETWKEIGLNVIIVQKYTKNGLKTIYRRVA